MVSSILFLNSAFPQILQIPRQTFPVRAHAGQVCQHLRLLPQLPGDFLFLIVQQPFVVHGGAFFRYHHHGLVRPLLAEGAGHVAVTLEALVNCGIQVAAGFRDHRGNAHLVPGCGSGSCGAAGGPEKYHVYSAFLCGYTQGEPA